MSPEDRERENAERMRSARRLPPDDVALALRCECRNRFCTDFVALTMTEYESAREGAGAAVLALRHLVMDGRPIVHRTARFAVVAAAGA